MVTIIANIEVGDDVYTISAEDTVPEATAELILRARTKLLAGLTEKEEKDESNNR